MTNRNFSGEMLTKAQSSRACEVSWFAPLCSDDFEFLGVPDFKLKSSFEHVSKIVKKAEEQGFNNMLFPSSFQVGQDPLVFAGAMSQHLTRMNCLIAIRTGEIHPPMLGRALATLDHLLKGRLTINIITSDLPGLNEAPEVRHARARETIQILKDCWQREQVQHKGEVYPALQLPNTDASKMYQQNGGPLLYFGGLSPLAKELCAEFCDVFLMWPEDEASLAGHIADMNERAMRFDRRIDFGLRIHLIVRETEKEAQEAAARLLSRLDDDKGAEIRSRALDAQSFGVSRQTLMRDKSDSDGYLEEILWTGVGRARSGCGCALVGTPDQILNKINRYIDMGIRAFIFSGYPHFEECERVGRWILPKMETVSLPHLYGRVPSAEPLTPLAAGPRR